MKKRLCLLFLPLLLLACSPKDEAPGDLISAEKMTRILTDVHLTEAALSRTIKNFDTTQVAYKQARTLILKRHSVTDSAFKHSYAFYLLRPELLDKVYDAVLDSLSQREARLTPRTNIDSLPAE